MWGVPGLEGQVVAVEVWLCDFALSPVRHLSENRLNASHKLYSFQFPYTYFVTLCVVGSLSMLLGMGLNCAQ